MATWTTRTSPTASWSTRTPVLRYGSYLCDRLGNRICDRLGNPIIVYHTLGDINLGTWSTRTIPA